MSDGKRELADRLEADGKVGVYTLIKSEHAILVSALRASASAASPEREEPVAWLVGWHRANGDSGLSAYVNQDDAQRAAKNLEDYSAGETMADVQPLFATPSPAMEAVEDGGLLDELRSHERDYPSLIHGPLCGRAANEIESLRAQLATATERGDGFQRLNDENLQIVREYGARVEGLETALATALAFIRQVAECEQSDNVNIRRARELIAVLTNSGT